ncbi:ATP-binding protein [Mycetocola zhujimingii]|nr:ATP-binding protein [Mycetocola zhujimingii]
MSEQHPTLIGRVVAIVGSALTVELESDMAGISPTWNGQLHSVGQVGTTVSLPQGTSKLLAVVTRISISGVLAADISDLGTRDSRSMEVQLIGEIDSLGSFHRGVTSYPGIHDAVHFVSGDELVPIYPRADSSHIQVGTLSSNKSIKVSLDLEKLVMRHSAVVGSTGAGKSSAVAAILQGLEHGPWFSANVIVIDSHGEYASALGTQTNKIDFSKSTDAILPAWMLPAEDLLRVLIRGEPAPVLRSKFTVLVAEARRRFAKDATWLSLAPEEVNADSPIPFDLRAVWFELDEANRRTFNETAKITDAISVSGDAQNLVSSIFKPHGAGGAAPFKGPEHGSYAAYPDLIRRALQDPRNAFLAPGDLVAMKAADPLPGIVGRLLGGTARISLLDVSGVSGEAAGVVVGTILQLIFELALRGKADGIGRNSPILIVIEEAHRYFQNDASNRLARETVERIAREGRKYGVGVMLVSQRPSELPQTAMSQLGTIIALRLSNDSDQSSISSALPDGVAGMVQSLPSLKTGEAIITGESLPIPSRVLISRPRPWPDSGDPKISAWSEPGDPVDFEPSIHRWRTNEEPPNK